MSVRSCGESVGRKGGISVRSCGESSGMKGGGGIC